MWKRYNHAIESQQYHKGFQPLSEPNGEVSSYAEAWRILGTYIDCTPTDDDDGQGNGDDGDAPLCKRWWIYAAYIDENNAGNGLTEYQYMDPVTGKWIEVCDLGDESQRCKRMDCHEPDTHFTHIGTYKILQQDGDFFDQLFKHQGYCVWDDDQYEFMQQAKDRWPDGCTQAEDIYDSNGNKVYYDLKPLEFGKQTVGLYSDPSCIHSLSDEESNYLWDNVMRGGDGDDHDDDISYLYSNLALWDQAMDMFRVCQPCISYRFPSVRAAYSTSHHWWRERKLENAQADVDDGSPFYCNDAAGYQNVNQCYKFASKTDMQRASFEDLQLAHVQGTILKVNYDAVSLGKVPMDDVRGERKIIFARIYLYASLFSFSLAFVYYLSVRFRVISNDPNYFKKPRARRRRIRFMDREALLDGTQKNMKQAPIGTKVLQTTRNVTKRLQEFGPRRQKAKSEAHHEPGLIAHANRVVDNPTMHESPRAIGITLTEVMTDDAHRLVDNHNTIGSPRASGRASVSSSPRRQRSPSRHISNSSSRLDKPIATAHGLVDNHTRSRSPRARDRAFASSSPSRQRSPTRRVSTSPNKLKNKASSGSSKPDMVRPRSLSPSNGVAVSHISSSARRHGSPYEPKVLYSPRSTRKTGMSPTQHGRNNETSPSRRPGGARSPSPRRIVASQMSSRRNHPSSPTRSPSPNKKNARASSPYQQKRSSSSPRRKNAHSPGAQGRMIQPRTTMHSESPVQKRSSKSPGRRAESWNANG